MDINRILQIAVHNKASDIHLKVGRPPMFRVDGTLHPLKQATPITADEMRQLATDVMGKGQQAKFREQLDVDFSYNAPQLGRFRVNAFLQRGHIGMVFRVIPTTILSVDDLLLPQVLKSLCEHHRGMILVTGATGSGKSTTLAAMVDHINQSTSNHIITIEDPVEFVIRDRRCIINQREVGQDARSFAQALKAALRQDPDVILVGEMRDIETVEIAMKAAETGHLVMSTLHTVDAPETIGRVVSMFPPHQHGHVRAQLASLLRGVVSQRLVPRKDERGRVPAVEVLVSTAQVRELITTAASARLITDAMAKGHSSHGSQTFDQSLMWLLRNEHITYEQALAQSTNPDDFALRFSGIQSGESGSAWDDFEGGEPTDASSIADGHLELDL